jgi:hypothetical protein
MIGVPVILDLMIPNQTYDAIIRAQGIDTVAPNSWHFGRRWT